ncbi:FG-GAP repeat domain-containing protein [Nocardia sp. NPDC059236]|uniref:FG-GAP repeat domain-containing protein n=1 Tax=Nocardia sp. NPDC059236 TaxID=3346783 RepID=UPI0036A051B4
MTDFLDPSAAADFDGDGKAEVLIESEWGIGVLKQNGANLTATVMAQNGTRLGGWNLNTANDDVALVGDFDGDGVAEVLVRSGWGIGVLKQNGANLTATVMAQNGTRLGGWNLNTTERGFHDQFVAAADFDGDGKAEVLIESEWGIGVLKQNGANLTATAMAKSGTRLGGWLLNTTVAH